MAGLSNIVSIIKNFLVTFNYEMVTYMLINVVVEPAIAYTTNPCACMYLVHIYPITLRTHSDKRTNTERKTQNLTSFPASSILCSVVCAFQVSHLQEE